MPVLTIKTTSNTLKDKLPKQKKIPKRASSKEYINNAKFTETVSNWIQSSLVQEMKEVKVKFEADPEDFELENLYQELYRKSISSIPNYMAECFVELANRIGSRPNFSGYSYIDDMKGDALLLCAKYAHNFDPEKSSNAFAYFSQVIFNGFKQYLNKEKKYANQKFDLTKDTLDGTRSNNQTVENREFGINNGNNTAEGYNYKHIVGSNRDEDGNYIDG